MTRNRHTDHFRIFRIAILSLIVTSRQVGCSEITPITLPSSETSQEEILCGGDRDSMGDCRNTTGDNCPDESEATQNILHTVMTGYNKQVLPSKYGVEVRIELHINDIPSLSELRSEFVLDLMYSEMWVDSRLQYGTRFPDIPATCVSNVTLDLDYLQKVWSPNTCIVNSKSAVIHASPSPNVFLILYQDGNVWKNCRMMVMAPCEIDLRSFPFDTQKCHMVFESYSFNSQKVRLRWFEKAPITLVKKMELPDFTLTHWEAQHNLVEYPNGYWDQLQVTFYFKRRYGFFVMQAYIPTYMTIFVAWINFWMDAKELSTRATLAISAFLAITLQFGNILKNQPPVSYVKSLDVWMLGCICFLFVSLAELTVVSYMMRTDKPQSRNGAASKNSNVANRTTRRKFKITTYMIDKICLILFPPAFLVFNIFYWLYYGPGGYLS